MFQFTFNYLCTFKNSARFFFNNICSIIFFHRRFIYMTLLEWSPFAHGSVWSGTISIVCTARRH